MPPLPKKKTQVLAEKHAYGDTIGKLKAEEHFRTLKKGWIKTVRTHIENSIEKEGMVKLAALGITTYLVKNIIHSSDTLISGWASNLQHALERPSEAMFKGVKAVLPFGEFLEVTRFFKPAIPSAETGFLPFKFTPTEVSTEPYAPDETEKRMIQEGIVPEYMEWMLAFVLAYIVINFGGQIILAVGDIIGNILGLAKFLVGVI